MTILCAAGCHVTLTNADACMCGAVAAWDALSDEALFNFEDYCAANNQSYPASGGIFPGYNPYGPPRPNTPPVVGQAPPIGVAQFKAAQSILEATHLSADGERVYIQMSDGVRVCYWDEEAKRFGSSFPCFEGLPADAVKM